MPIFTENELYTNSSAFLAPDYVALVPQVYLCVRSTATEAQLVPLTGPTTASCCLKLDSNVSDTWIRLTPIDLTDLPIFGVQRFSVVELLSMPQRRYRVQYLLKPAAVAIVDLLQTALILVVQDCSEQLGPSMVVRADVGVVHT